MRSERKWERGETYDHLQFPTGVTEVGDGSGFVVAFVPLHKGSARYETRRKWPDLIAAAPELYEALEAAKDFIENLQLPDAEWSRVLDASVAALAKARGESHD